MADVVLQKPTVELVHEYAKIFDDEYSFSEQPMQKLIEAMPSNVHAGEICAKVVVLNKFYATNVYAVNRIAEHIFKIKELDYRLRSGDESVVEEIRLGHGIQKKLKTGVGGKEIDFYSFATKYCSWHNKCAYPIYDSRVERLLRNYRDQYQERDNGLGKFTWDQFHVYGSFKQVLADFREMFGLHSIDARMLDKFLYQYSLEVMPHKAE